MEVFVDLGGVGETSEPVDCPGGGERHGYPPPSCTPRYRFRGSLIEGLLVAGPGMTESPSRAHDPGVVSSGLVHRWIAV